MLLGVELSPARLDWILIPDHSETTYETGRAARSVGWSSHSFRRVKVKVKAKVWGLTRWRATPILSEIDIRFHLPGLGRSPQA